MFKRTIAVLLCFAATAASARIISYSPYTNQTAVPAVQHRMNRHFVLVESSQPLGFSGPILAPLPWGGAALDGEIVLYDSQGLEEPRVVFPKDRPTAPITLAAVREENNVVTILMQEAPSPIASPPIPFWRISTDSGATWKDVPLPGVTVYGTSAMPIDIGGPYVRARYSQVRIGNSQYPFVVLAGGAFSAVGADASVKILATVGTTGSALVGQNREGTKFLIRDGQTYFVVGLDGTKQTVGAAANNGAVAADGWITPNGEVYVQEQNGMQIMLSIFQGGVKSIIAEQSNGETLGIFAIPTADYSGAWIIFRGASRPTVLSKHTIAGGRVEQWSDVTAPQVEALHAGNSGNTVLVQVHRDRPVDTRRFVDPALAVWRVGEGAPRVYDELYMNEQWTKAFVHVDPDKVGDGDPFVFDSGVMQPSGGIIISPAPPSGGGSDVIQEWGVVRASLKQQLVLPGIARTAGAYNSYWLTDVVIYNPVDAPQKVNIRYVPTGDAVTASDVKEQTLTLAAKEIRVVRDALKSLFNLETGGGAFYVTPESGVNVTSRTYTQAPQGTYGFGMNGIDVFTAARPRFPVSFAGALQGSDYRTNLIVTDVSGRGAEAGLIAVSNDGFAGAQNVAFTAPAGGQSQINNIGASLGISSGETGAVVVRPARGEVIASIVTIDNRTNDPTHFPPDLPLSTPRTIPAIGHIDGANNSKFRSDLFLYNPSDEARTVILQMKMWDSPATQTVNFTMLPHEARVIRDVLFRLFNRTGIAKLIVTSTGDGVRVTSRTYNVDENGGTYGFLMPPLNSFQSGTSGDVLEILGVVGDSRYRTNIGIVDFDPFSRNVTSVARIEIIDHTGKVIDSFRVNVPSAGGMQINDVFRERGIPAPTAALIRVHPEVGVLGAYATLNDNGTNDPTYLAANLGAKQ